MNSGNHLVLRELTKSSFGTFKKIYLQHIAVFMNPSFLIVTLFNQNIFEIVYTGF